jgi:signal peptidase I
LETMQTESELQPAGEQPTEEQPTTSVFWQFMLDLFETVLLAVVLFLGINAVSARVRVDGFSMLPTLQDSEFVLVNKLAYKVGQPHRGDIIVFRYPGQPPQDLIKRVIGLPGDQILVRDGHVFVNGAQIDEPYIAAAPRYSGNWTVTEGSLFVLGDNRNDSSDSHSWGLVPEGNVIGKGILIYWPPPEWAMIDHANVAVAAP